MLATIGTSAQTLVAATSGCPASVPSSTSVGLIFQAHPDNTGYIHFSTNAAVSVNGVLTCGFIVPPGGGIICIPIDLAKDANQISVVATADAQKLIWDNARMGS